MYVWLDEPGKNNFASLVGFQPDALSEFRSWLHKATSDNDFWVGFWQKTRSDSVIIVTGFEWAIVGLWMTEDISQFKLVRAHFLKTRYRITK